MAVVRGDTYYLDQNSALFQWRAERNEDGTRTVYEHYPDGTYRTFENVPATLVDRLLTERRREINTRIGELKRHMMERQHILGDRYDTGRGGPPPGLPILDAIDGKTT